MTEEQFFQALEKTKDRFIWYLFGKEGIIRCTSVDRSMTFCPLTALCFDQGKGFLLLHQYTLAATKLHLDWDFAEFIKNAADGRALYEIEKRFEKKMKRMLGL